MISAPSEMRCRSIPIIAMTKNVAASTIGIVRATTRPARQPSASSETTNTMPIASASASRNSWIDLLTTCAWSEMRPSSTPMGRSCSMRFRARSTAAPTSVTLAPGAMVVPSSTASRPW